MNPRRSSIANVAKGAAATIRRHKPDYHIALYMGLLMLLGLIVIYAIGPQRAGVLNNAYGASYNDTYFFMKQVVSLLIAIAAFVALALTPYAFLQKYAAKILIIGFSACLLLAFAGNLLHIDQIAVKTLGAYRWFNLGPIGTIQPSEILKFGMLIFFAGFLGMRAKQGLINDTHRTLIPLGVVLGAALLFIVVIQKDLGTGIALSGIIACMLMVAGINKRLGLMLLSIAFVVGLMFIFTTDHRRERITAFMQGDTMSVGSNESYHIDQAKLAIGSGGLIGVGIGNSVQATGYLPEAINDSVFAVMGEMFGFVGLVAILGLFVGLLIRLLKIGDHLPDIQLRLLIAGIFGWLAIHVILNVAAMIGIFPLTGVTLPLVSFGGTSMIFVAGALGLAFQLSRYTSHVKTIKETHDENSSSRRGVGRTRHAGRRSSSRI